jgi:hypothetical protein
MFAEPTESDFQRMVTNGLERSQAEIVRATMAVQYKFSGNGVLGSSRFPLALEEAITPIFSKSMHQAMQLATQVAEKSSLSLEELTKSAHVELIKFLEFCVGQVGRHANVPGATNVAQTFREKLRREIDNAEQDLKIGFIGGTPATMAEPATGQAKALKLLKAIYDVTRDSDTPVFVVELGDRTGLSEAEAQAAWRYLRDRRLIDTFSIPNTGRINANGVDAIEAATHAPDRPSTNFPSVTYNVVNNTVHMGTAINSPVQQGGVGSAQHMTATFEANDLKELQAALKLLATHLEDLTLSEADQRKAKAQIVTMQSQLESDPDPLILRQAGRTLRNITEGAIAGLIATGVQPAVWAAASALFTKLFS